MSTPESAVQSRDLSAILFADVHGYTRLMSKDEEGTRARVAQSIGLIKSLISDYGGRVMNVAGDGVLALFGSASQAVKFAIEIQREFRNDAVWHSEDEPIAFRIGINLGEVLIDETGVQGHSVNVAARIQSISPPGGVCISESVQQVVRDALGIRIRSLGQQSLKNIAEPVEVFSVEINGSDAPPKILQPLRDEAIEPPSEASVAVLPLENLSGDPRDNHICDGVTGDVITNLSRFRDLLVIARHSAFLFKNQKLPTEQIGRQLGIRYLMTGGLQRAGSKIRIRIQLTEVESERVIWSERYSGNLSDIFTFQDDVTAVIAARLSVEIATAERHRQVSALPPNLHAYGLILRGQDLGLRVAREANLHARRLFEQATEIDPGYARSYVGMSRTFNQAWRFRWADPPEPSLDKAVDLAEQAIVLDPADSRGYAALGSACLYKRQHDQALAAYERATELNPNDADVLAEMGHTVSCRGETDRAVKLLRRAMRLNPYYPDWYLWHLGEAFFDLGDYEKTIQTLNRMHDKAEAFRLLTASHALLGQMEEAHSCAQQLLVTQPEFTLAHWSKVPPDRNPEPRERLIEGLVKAGLK
jgi:TolB-like protein